MSTTEVRNSRVQAILNSLYAKAVDEHFVIDESAYSQALNVLFSTTAWGFREILLVVIVGMKLDKDFKSSTGLYDCNPRAIYEGPIKEFFIEKDIPHRKSGPLNVAKATVGLDMTWAAQRRPSAVAEQVVHLVTYLETDTEEQKVDAVGVALLRRLISYSHKLAELSIEIEPSEDPDFLYHLCFELITKAPDAGNTPQRVAAFLLSNYHRFLNTGIEVTGGDDRASVTSTTSKKPGDINEEKYGRIYKVYEITVKPFDIARIRDSYDCVSIYNDSLVDSDPINEIIVICRSEDCPTEMIRSGMHGYLGSYAYQEIIYYYWDIYEWIANTLQHMTADCRKGFYLSLNAYIRETNTSETVKKLWRQLHQ